VLVDNLSPELESEVSLYLAFLYKRMGLFEDAAEIWQNAVEGSFLSPLRAHEELAKYYEHKKKDYHLALSFVDKAISHLNCDLAFSTQSALSGRLASFEYRRSRLEKKIKKVSVKEARP
jgi:tetratricopeptide (TPR) repeat protein